MITATYNTRHGEKTVRVDHLVNRGEWWGETWLFEVGVGFWSIFYVIEAGNEQDAIDIFADSKHSHMIDTDDMCDNCANGDYDNCNYCTYAGNDSHRVNLDNVWITRCKVNYFAKKEDK